MTNGFRWGAPFALLAASLVVGGCASTPEQVATLEEARSTLASVQQDPLAREAAGNQVARSQEALRLAEQAYEDDEPIEEVEHRAYVALRNAQIAEQLIAEERGQRELSQGEAQRSQVLLQARTREAEQAQSQAQQAQSQAEQAQALAEQRERQAEQARAAAVTAQQEAQSLEQELADLQAEQTERGLVLTLGDVLFDTDEAMLKPGAASTMDQLAQFMRDHPERRLLIEGHTDSRGPEEYNRALSEDRANAVRDALVDRGIDASRIQTEGLGEAFPVASNETSAGMQQNRRVEIVVSDRNGQLPSSPQRPSSVSQARPG